MKRGLRWLTRRVVFSHRNFDKAFQVLLFMTIVTETLASQNTLTLNYTYVFNKDKTAHSRRYTLYVFAGIYSN